MREEEQGSFNDCRGEGKNSKEAEGTKHQGRQAKEGICKLKRNSSFLKGGRSFTRRTCADSVWRIQTHTTTSKPLSQGGGGGGGLWGVGRRGGGGGVGWGGGGGGNAWGPGWGHRGGGLVGRFGEGGGGGGGGGVGGGGWWGGGGGGGRGGVSEKSLSFREKLNFCLLTRREGGSESAGGLPS